MSEPFLKLEAKGGGRRRSSSEESSSDESKKRQVRNKFHMCSELYVPYFVVR
jgi:hypothetical protein